MQSLRNQNKICMIVVMCCALFFTHYFSKYWHTCDTSVSLSPGPLVELGATSQDSVMYAFDTLKQKLTFSDVEEDYMSALRKNVSGISLPWWETESISDCSPLMQNNIGEGKESIINEVSHDLKQFYKFTLRGHCGIRASLRGSRQKIVSYSLYGANEEYWRGLPEILDDIKKMYPGWLVRLHTDPRDRFDFLCPLRKQNPHLFICDIKNLPNGIGNVASLNPMLWRSAPFGDEEVEWLIVRDTDSRILRREVAAVSEWEAAKKFLHVMRDHPQHGVKVMGGMFGIWQPSSVNKVFEFIRKRLYHPNELDDQTNLGRELAPFSFGSSVQHSSFNCDQFKGSQPFPTRRQDGAFVGSPVYRKKFENNTIRQPCPWNCRPKEHKDWEYC